VTVLLKLGGRSRIASRWGRSREWPDPTKGLTDADLGPSRPRGPARLRGARGHRHHGRQASRSVRKEIASAHAARTYGQETRNRVTRAGRRHTAARWPTTRRPLGGSAGVDLGRLRPNTCRQRRAGSRSWAPGRVALGRGTQDAVNADLSSRRLQAMPTAATSRRQRRCTACSRLFATNRGQAPCRLHPRIREWGSGLF